MLYNIIQRASLHNRLQLKSKNLRRTLQPKNFTDSISSMWNTMLPVSATVAAMEDRQYLYAKLCISSAIITNKLK